MDDSLTLLIDAPSLFFRAFFSTPATVTTPEGAPINAAHGFMYMLARLIEDRRPDYLACGSDENWRPQWRVDLIPSYKEVRAQPDSQQAQTEVTLGPQVPVLYAMLGLFGIAVVGHPDAEAEDVIGTLAARAPGRVDIVSGDRDLFQLVEDPRIRVLYPVRGVSKVDVIDEAYIATKYGIPPRAYRDFAVLRGDTSDGLPGVRGIGEKTAASLVTKYGSLDTILDAARSGAPGTLLDKVRRDLDYVERAVEVCTITTDLDLPEIDVTLPAEVDEASVTAAAGGLGLKGPATALLRALQNPAGVN
ncbi:MAG TPA: 5'-3' exonuclease [Actinomycetota bacterium]|nr:5'-3' exonuclease [Actinomycetota bacterium]